jgi:phosphatidylserine/phosphatidylglycerophosphate/cardiolipin synthase-like enzyme
VGGYDNQLNGFSSAELYNPTTGKWTQTGKMAVDRYAHKAILLIDGQALIVGGNSESSNCLSKTELYVPKIKK